MSKRRLPKPPKCAECGFPRAFDSVRGAWICFVCQPQEKARLESSEVTTFEGVVIDST
jgi:predicted Zn-ribbon and HTH transcriptional regulator